MRTNFRSRRTRKSGKAFNPTHQDLNQAIQEFQQRGGQIQQLRPNKESLANFVQGREDRAVDEFLLGDAGGLRF